MELVAEARIPSSVELSDTRLIWSRDTASTPRTVDVIAGTGNAFDITGFSGLPAGQYHIEEETVTEGLRYRLTITPTESVTEGVKTLLISTTSADPRDRVKAVFLTMEKSSEESPSPTAR